MSEERNIKEDVMINRFSLEEESEKQASLFYYWSELLVDARNDRDRAKGKYKQTMSQAQLDYRSGVKELESKLTEKAIEAAVECDKDVIVARNAFFEAEKEVNRLEAAVNSMGQKKSMLGHLVQLFTQQYYANPSGSKYTKQDDASDTMNKKLNKRNKGDE